MILNENSTLSLEDIRYICSKMSSMLKLPIYFLGNDHDILFEYSYEYSKNPLYKNINEIFMDFLNLNNGKNFFNLISTTYYENYFSIQVNSNNNLIGTILVGPTISTKMNAKSIDLLIKDINIPVKYKEDLVNYYNSIVVIDFNSFIDAGLLLYYSIYNRILNLNDIYRISDSPVNINFKNENLFDISESKKRRDNIFHHSPNYERELLECIKEGNIENLTKFFNSNTITGEKGIHSKNPLRNEKNLIISFISLVSHAAIEGGLDWELALSLSDFYILSVEECNSIKEVYELSSKMIIDYTERTHEVKMGKYSSSIRKCQNLIFEHLYKKISLTELADHLGMNSSYLSHLFKKEVGISISEYIQIERIKEAQKLIRAGEKSLSDIYIPLCFIDQSHFTKAFKKVAGITPKQYKLLYKE